MPNRHSPALKLPTILQVAFILLFFSVLACSPNAFASVPKKRGDIDINLTPLAKAVIFTKTAVLPFGMNEEGAALTRLFHRELDQTEKYDLLPIDQIDQFLLEYDGPGNDSLGLPPGVDIGRRLFSRGVITGQVITSPELSLQEGDGSTPHRKLIITMLDSQSTETAWTITIPLPPAPQNLQQLSSTTNRLLSDSVQMLLSALIEYGAIYSTRILEPSVLSTQGLIRGSRIVLHPAPEYVHSKYQLLRSNSPRGVFRPTGSGTANNSTPLVLEDTKLADASTYYYTVIGIAPSGLASIPLPPFSVTTKGQPQPVQSFNATGNGLRQILLSWELSPDPDVTGYVIYRSMNKKEEFSPIVEIDDPDRQSFLDRGGAKTYERFGKLQDNTRYYYTIRSRNRVAVESPASQTVSAETKGPPSPPNGLQAIDRQPRKVSLSWLQSDDQHTKGYMLFRADANRTDFVKIAFIPGRENTEYVDEGSFTDKLDNNTRYSYRLQAVNVVDINSEDSATVSAVTKPAPEPVRQLPPSKTGVREITLRWSPNNEPDIASYEILRGTFRGDVSTKRGIVPADQTRYTDKGLKNGESYWYSIRAIDLDRLKGEPSEPLQGTTKPAPAPPSELKARVTAQGIELHWAANREQDIVLYAVYSVSILNREIKRVEQNSLVITESLEPGREYRFQVVAIDADGLESVASEMVRVTLPPDWQQKND